MRRGRISICDLINWGWGMGWGGPLVAARWAVRGNSSLLRRGLIIPSSRRATSDVGKNGGIRSKRANLSSFADEILADVLSIQTCTNYHFVTRAFCSDLLGATHEACGAHSFMSWA